MKKSCLLIIASSLILAACNGQVSDSSSRTSSNSENSSAVSEETTLGKFLREASSSYSFKGLANEVSSSSGVNITSANYLDFASKDGYFSITKYLEVLNGLGSLTRNSVSSDIRYKEYAYEDKEVVASSYLSLANVISYDVKKDDYGYTTAWGDSFESFFSLLEEEDFTSEDNLTYTLNTTDLNEKIGTAILYQTGYLSPSSTTSFSFSSLSLGTNNGVIDTLTLGLIDATSETITSTISLQGTIVVGKDAEKDVKVEEVVSGDELEELDNAFKSLANYNFDFDLSVIISRTVQKEYATTAHADGKKAVSDRFAYVESDEGLEYYLSPTDEGLYKTMETVSDAKLKDILPSFDISTCFFSKSADKTYILSNRAKRCSASAKDFSIYQPFGLSFSNVTIKLADNSVMIVGTSGSYEFDMTYTNIGKKSGVTFEGANTLNFGDYIESNSGYFEAYAEFAEAIENQLNLSDLKTTYDVMNAIPFYHTYRMSKTPYFMGYQFKLGRTTYGSMFEYATSAKRDLDFQGVQTFYLENGFTKRSSEENDVVLAKNVTVGEEEIVLGLRILATKNEEIPIIGVFPILLDD